MIYKYISYIIKPRLFRKYETGSSLKLGLALRNKKERFVDEYTDEKVQTIILRFAVQDFDEKAVILCQFYGG